MLILASASPRRAELLERIGLPCRVVAAQTDESVPPSMPAADVPVVLAERKARIVAAAEPPDAFVLAADTVGIVDGRVLGKPQDKAEARAMLAALAGRTHDVITGVAVAHGGRVAVRSVSTRVSFAPLPATTMDAYVATGEPMGKAGAYAIQGMADAFITRIEGSYSNVVGLPTRAVVEMLAEAGYRLPAHLQVAP